jgi:phosphoribosyl-ATP pyrophosphohydrolase/phosphoribosyl-AMP cyclohydrolase
MSDNKMDFLIRLQDLIDQRNKEMPDNSYTTSLFKEGINKIAQKVGEETIELIIEAKDSNKELFLNESADLLYHFLVLQPPKVTGLRMLWMFKGRHR